MKPSSELARRFIEQVNNVFCFLVKEYGFSEPEFNETGWGCSVTFAKGQFRVEAGLDWRDQHYGVTLAWFEGGMEPENVYTNAHGDIRRAYLSEIVQGRGGHEWVKKVQALYKSTDKKNEIFIDDHLVLDAEALRAYAEDILKGSARWFEEASERKKQQTIAYEKSGRAQSRLIDQAVSEAGHAFKCRDFSKVITLLAPYENQLSPKQLKKLELSRAGVSGGAVKR